MENIEPSFSLKPAQREVIGLLSIGTFLEYFNLMLYVHMAVLLNELFFPKTDPYTASLLSAFAFCSTYVLRPFGALVFGYIGDKIGRKSTVIITITMMSVSCLIMANLPTYAQIGITASWIITVCRMFQGISSMGEVVGACIYITEITKPPIQYPSVSLIAISGALGMTASLAIASLVTSYGFNWRVAFWMGTGIAIIGTAARIKLRETYDFADAKRRVKKALKNTHQDLRILEKSLIWNEKINKKTAISFFFIECLWPVSFYFAYIYCGDILRSSFNFTPEEVIHQNLVVSIVQLTSCTIVTFLSYRIYPLNILKFKLVIFAVFTLLCPYLLDNASSPSHILLIQSIIVMFGLFTPPAIPIFYKHFPIFRRFTCAVLIYSLSRSFIYVVTSLGLAHCSDYFGYWGVLVIMIPTIIAFMYGLNHFYKLEKVNLGFK